MKNALSQAWQGITNWVMPKPMSPVAEPKLTSIFQPGGFQQAVNNVMAVGTLQPQLVRGFLAATPTQSPPVQQKPVTQPKPTAMQQARQQVKQPSPTPQQVAPVAQGQQYGGYSLPEYQAAIQEGFKHWGSPPAATMAAQMAQAIATSPIYQKYPFLIPAITLNETGGGNPDKIAYPNNITNWGIRSPGYQPATTLQNLQDMITGVAGTRQLVQPTESPYNWWYRQPGLQQFRQSMDLRDLANFYAPKSDNPLYGGDVYAKNLQDEMNYFNSQLPKR